RSLRRYRPCCNSSAPLAAEPSDGDTSVVVRSGAGSHVATADTQQATHARHEVVGEDVLSARRGLGEVRQVGIAGVDRGHAAGTLVVHIGPYRVVRRRADVLTERTAGVEVLEE